jgi:phosphatidylserine/phosphatidylglycerophosphate/cardiolipin synthase-like enzyme
MRFKSPTSHGFTVFAVTGVNTVSFGIAASAQAKHGLLGFHVERVDPTEHEAYTMPGFKVFRSVIPQPGADTVVSTHDHPVQSFVWDDFTAKPGRQYEYVFHPLRGKPKNLDRSTPPVRINVRTEPLTKAHDHDVFFNRGVASSQAYQREFGNKTPDQLAEPKRTRAHKWLVRDLEEALLRFIREVKPGDGLRCCFYEFRYAPVAEELKKAIDRGVDVKIIVDAKVNQTIDKKGVVHESFPREDNLHTIAAAHLPASSIIQREARADAIQHNKFMVRLEGAARTPTEVWTGSTNISLGGLSGQTNVGHWVRDATVAAQFVAYWNLLLNDPGGVTGDSATDVRKKNAAFRKAVAELRQVPTAHANIPAGCSSVFSPRSGMEVLEMYAAMADQATSCACVTLAFGVSAVFKSLLQDNTSVSPIVFLLLEKKDVKNPSSTKPFVALRARNNVYEAWGSYIKDPVYQWAKETNTRALGLNTHVAYIHSKFLLMDPLGADPIVVTGSANFSEPSTNENDENMLLVRGNPRVADIYFTEFNRLFNHYYFRAVHESVTEHAAATAGATAGVSDEAASLFLVENDTWVKKYEPGKLRAKRLKLFTDMAGAEEI